MIKVNKIIPQTVEAFDPDGNSLGFLNYFEFNDLRIQIMKEKVEGYYMMFNNERIDIDRDGDVHPWRIGFYDMGNIQINEMVDLHFSQE